MPPAPNTNLRRVSKAGASDAKPGQLSQRGQESSRKKAASKSSKGKERND